LRYIRNVIACLLTAGMLVSVVAQGGTREGYTTSIYEGQITSIKIAKCGLQPGLCEGSIVLAGKAGDDTTLDVRVGTWIKRGDRFLTIDELQVGDRVKAQAFKIAGEAAPRVAILEFTGP
jgi:hypothetical protein